MTLITFDVLNAPFFKKLLCLSRNKVCTSNNVNIRHFKIALYMRVRYPAGTYNTDTHTLTGINRSCSGLVFFKLIENCVVFSHF